MRKDMRATNKCDPLDVKLDLTKDVLMDVPKACYQVNLLSIINLKNIAF